MASEPTAWSEAGTAHVRVVGPDDAVPALDAADRFSVTVDPDPATTDAALAAGEGVDCVVVAASIPADALSALVDRAREAGDVPVVAVADGEAARAALDAGAVDVVGPDAALAVRVDWVCGGTAGHSPDDSGVPRTDIAASSTTDVLDAFGEGYFELDRRWRVVDLNDRAADLFGLRTDALLESNLWRARPDLLDTPFPGEYATAIRTGDPVSFEAYLDRGERWVDVRAFARPDGIATQVRDVTEQVTERRTLERFERILETIDDGVYTLDEDFVMTFVNEAVTELTGYDRDELVGTHVSLLADESVIVEAGEAIQEILAGERDSGLIETELACADGSSVPIETHFSAIGFDDGSYGSVGVVRDITERKRYERTLTELNRSINGLFGAESKGQVARLVVDTAAEDLDLGTVAVYLFDEEVGVLQPAEWRTGVVPSAIEPGEGALWRGFVEGEPVDLSSVPRSDRIAAGGIALPLGEHGLLIVGAAPDADRGPPEDRLGTLARLLSTNAEAALDRVDRRLELTRRERELARRNEELRELNRFNELLRDINESLIEAETREGIEQAVCEQLASSGPIEFAWIGEYDGVNDAVEPRAWAGAERGYLDRTPTGTGEDDEPSLRAVRSGTPVFVDNVAEGMRRRTWRQRALSRQFRSVASVPLEYSDVVYGVLAVYASQSSAFDESMRTMLAELGRTTANAINGVEAKETLRTESVVEVDLRIPAPGALTVRMARAVGGDLSLEGVVPSADGRSRLFLSVRDPTEPLDALESVAAVERVQHVSGPDDDALVEVDVDGPTVPARLTDLGAAIRSLDADGDAVRAVVELPGGSDVRRFVEAVEESYPGTELAGRRRHERPVETRRAFLGTVEEELTDRQLEVLRTAFLSGYFEWPRTRSGEDVADSLDIAQSTFNRHLRVAERKLFSRLFGPT